MTGRLASALAERDGELVVAADDHADRAERLWAKLAALDPDQLAAIERVVDCILDPEAPR